ncbi:MAG: non-heme iron oxygenase ferredoxin subunit [Lysobacterales bacterium]
MGDWIDVCAEGEIGSGEYRLIELADTLVAVYCVDGEHYAIEDVCTHDGAELAGGPLCGFELECPRHGARFDLRTGRALCPPAYVDTHVFPLRVEDGRVQFRDDRDD